MATWMHNLDPFALQIGGGFGLRWYGLAYLAAFASAYLIYVHLAKRGCSVLPLNKVGDFITGCAVFGVLVGGRLGFMLFYDFDGFVGDPLVFFRVWEGGMSAHGGILGVVIYTFWFAWRYNLNWPGLGDNLVVGVPLGLFFGRMANFINGELYGRPSSVPWSVFFPKAVYQLPVERQREVLLQSEQIVGRPVGLDQVVASVPESPRLAEMLGSYLEARHPSQLYEAVLEGLFLFFLLWILRTRVRLANGVITGMFFIGYAVLRSLAELFREPDAGLVWGMTRGQFLSIFLVLIGLGFWIAARWRPSYPPLWAKVSTKKQGDF